MSNSTTPLRQRQRAGGTPFKKGEPRPANAGRRKGTPNKINSTMKEFFREFMESEEYKQSLALRILEGKAIPIEQLGLQHVIGKPAERVEVETPSLAKILEIGVKKGLSRIERQGGVRGEVVVRLASLAAYQMEH